MPYNLELWQTHVIPRSIENCSTISKTSIDYAVDLDLEIFGFSTVIDPVLLLLPVNIQKSWSTRELPTFGISRV